MTDQGKARVTAREVVRIVARRNGRPEPTGDDARQALEGLSAVRGELAAIAGELDRKAGL